MNGGKSDASTSTDDVKERPLCLYYFTHPFGILSPEPPIVSAASPAAFYDMQPLYWAAAAAAAAAGAGAPSPGPAVQFELGPTRVHARPLTVRLPPAPPRRAPLCRMLPPLHLPPPPHLADAGPEDVWPTRAPVAVRRLNRLSLPPIEMPAALSPPASPPPPPTRRVGRGGRRARRRRDARGGDVRRMVTCLLRRAVNECGSRSGSAARRRGGGASPALQRALATIRHAWASPAALAPRCRIMRHIYKESNEGEDREGAGAGGSTPNDSRGATTPPDSRGATTPPDSRGATTPPDSRGATTPSAAFGATTPSAAFDATTPSPAFGGATTPVEFGTTTPLAAAHASPGLLHRRYSVPEVIMRKYRLAQQNSDTEMENSRCSGGAGASEATTPAPPRSAGDSPRRARLDRELMRKSALLRRLWPRPPPPAACRCAARSLASSQDELTPAPAPFSERLVCDTAAPYELLEICVSESVPSAGPVAPLQHVPSRDLDLDLDEYVSRVLLESLNSLTDRLEDMNATVGADRKLSVVEKEIKVRLQNAAVNTIVHLSPTSNHQIIFGNEELGGRTRGDGRGEERDESREPLVREPDDAEPHQDGVNHAVLRQIQKLFRDELRHADAEASLRDVAAVSYVEISRIDGAASEGSSAPLSGVGAGNYFCDAERAAVVPRRCALPHSASMEVNTSDEDDAPPDALASDAASLVDSLDDPASPRLHSAAPPEAFFVPIRDDATPESARVAEYMPERIRRRLHRRQRTRELRLECARRSRARRLQEELQARRRDCLEREAACSLDALLDDVVGELTRAEAHAVRRDPRPAPPRRPVRDTRPPRDDAEDERSGRAAPAVEERPPRRIYQKSEIRDGDKCVEILEILEYSQASRSSSDGTGAAEERARSVRRSRIPVPVAERGDHMRLTGGDAAPLAHLLLRAFAPARPPPPEPRERSNSLRFRGVFDMIPEERTGPGADADSPRTRSAGTSPPALAQCSRTTMTSPGAGAGRSAGTSPWRAPPRDGACARGSAAPREGAVAAQSPKRRPARAGSGDSSSSCDSGGSLLCALAPRWLSGTARPRRRARRPTPAHRAPPSGAGSWSVTVAGSCRAALPADVEMRLRFPQEGRACDSRRDSARPPSRQECSCSSCCPSAPAPAPAAPPHALPPHRERLALDTKKETQDIGLKSRRSRKSFGQLPELEARGEGRARPAATVKTRRGYSLHCWLPAARAEPTPPPVPPLPPLPSPLRTNNGLSVLGCAIIPELKPRVPTMSERDLTRVYTPRHYLRS